MSLFDLEKKIKKLEKELYEFREYGINQLSSPSLEEKGGFVGSIGKNSNEDSLIDYLAEIDVRKKQLNILIDKLIDKRLKYYKTMNNENLEEKKILFYLIKGFEKVEISKALGIKIEDLEKKIKKIYKNIL